MDRFAIRLRHDSFTFSSCHLLVFPSREPGGDMIVEPLHGHDFRASCKITGPLDEYGCVVDFIDASRLFRDILDSFDHCVLLAGSSAYLNVSFDDSHTVSLTFGHGEKLKRWQFPRQEVLLLNVENTSTEQIAAEILKRFRAAFFQQLVTDRNASDYTFELELEESTGCSAIVNFF